MTLSLARADLVEVTVHDAAGRHVATLAKGSRPPGTGEMSWSGIDDGGHCAAPGVYLVRARFGHERTAMRVVKLE